MSFFLQMLSSGLTAGGIYALIAVGYNLIFNSSRVINFSQGEFFTFGALVTITMTTIAFHLPLPIGILLGVLAVVLLSMAMEKFFIRRVLAISPWNATVLAFGFIFVLEGLYLLLWGRDDFGGRSFMATRALHFFGASINTQALWVLLTVAIICLSLWLYFYHTKIGKGMRACAENGEVARLMGINTKGMVKLSFVLAGLAGALAGITISPMTSVNYTTGLTIMMKGFGSAVLGGMGNVFGAFVGGLVLGLLEAFVAGYVSTMFKDAIVYSLIVALLLFRPNGIFGKASETQG